MSERLATRPLANNAHSELLAPHLPLIGLPRVVLMAAFLTWQHYTGP